MLEALARSTNDDDRSTTRLWWTVCMGARIAECKQSYTAWKQQAAASLPTQLRPEHTEAAVSLPGFEPLAQCIPDRASAVNVDAGAMLDRVEAAGKQQAANAEWSRAVGDVEPLRHRLQESFLQQRSEPSFLQRALSRRAADGVALAPSAGEMELDELRVCQVWMYCNTRWRRDSDWLGVRTDAGNGSPELTEPPPPHPTERPETRPHLEGLVF
jgi:hypothetical protein